MMVAPVSPASAREGPAGGNLRVLLLEDNPGDARLVTLSLGGLAHEGRGFDVRVRRTLSDSLEALREEHYDAVIADLHLPDSCGPETVQALREAAPAVPVIVLTGVDEEATAVRIMKAGAQDYLIKEPSNGRMLGRAVLHAIERQRGEQRMLQLAHYDSLTGLANRVLFRKHLEHAIVRAHRDGTVLALMFIDLDRFKQINDNLGHDAGDALLTEVARRIDASVRGSDLVARLGGDEFTVILENIHSGDNATHVADKILAALEQPLNINGHELVSTPSIGITVFPDDGVDIDQLLGNADSAMYKAKEKGRNTYCFYGPDLNDLSLERAALEADLRTALARNEFVLQYQPKFDVASGRLAGMDALLRWKHGGELIAPERFARIAEEADLSIPIGDWALRRAAEQARLWQEAGLPAIAVAVNVNQHQFQQPDLVQRMDHAVAEAGLHPSLLVLELSESLLMEDVDASETTLAALRDNGFRIAVDAFGTGCSSLSQLRRFQLDSLKIDASFVRDVATDGDTAAIASAIIALAHTLRLTAVAEGVETAEQLRFLAERGCEQAQGALYCAPLSALEAAAFLGRQATAVVPRQALARGCA